MATRRSRAGADVLRSFLFGQRSSPSPFHRSQLAASFVVGTRSSQPDRVRGDSAVFSAEDVVNRRGCRSLLSPSGAGSTKYLEYYNPRGQYENKRFLSSNASVKAEEDGGLIAGQMIGYAAMNRKDVTTQVEVSRVLEQGYNFLKSQGPSKANAAVKVLLTLATIYVDGGKLEEAVDILRQVANLEGASVETHVSTGQALVGVLLRLRKDSDALLLARSVLELVNSAEELSKEVGHELKFRSEATVQLAEHVTNSNTTDKLLDTNEFPARLNHEETDLSGIALALLGIAECAHIRGHFAVAKEYYEKSSTFAKSCNERSSLEAIMAQDVLVEAEAGLGQVAAQLGQFDDAEKALTAALKDAEEINGPVHPRVGAVLSCLADVYAQRGISKGSGDLLLAEGLYRKAIDLLGASSLDRPASEQGVYLSDIIAISRARYGALVSRINNRESEAKRLQAWAAAAWKGPHSLTDVLSQDASTRPMDNTAQSREDVKDAYKGRFVVLDVRLGRVLYSA